MYTSHPITNAPPNTMQLHFQHVASSTTRRKNAVTLTLYGRMINGDSIAAHVHNLPHYGFFQCNHWDDIQSRVNKYIRAWSSYQTAEKYGIGDPDPDSERYVREDERAAAFQNMSRRIRYDFTETSGFNIRDVREGAENRFIRFETKSPNTYRAICHVLTKPRETKRTIQDWAESQGFEVELPDAFTAFMLYETHIKPDSQFMIDNQLTSCGWMGVRGSYTDKKTTTCTREIDVDAIAAIEPPQDLAPIRVLSYDIESQPHVYDDGREPGFPEPEHDPILTIGVTWFDLLDTTPRQAVFQLEPEGIPPLTSLAALRDEDKTDAFDPSTSEVHSYTCEKKLLAGFAAYVINVDPDVITGYNILGFDNPYLIKRAKALGFTSDKYRDTIYVHYNLGRTIGARTSLRKVFRTSNQTGGSESYQTSLEGRTWTDLFKVFMTDHKLRSYKMDEVAAEFLGTRKIHIAYSDIPEMQKTKEGRHTLATYCVKDSWIPCQLGIKRSKFINAMSMAKVTGVALDDVLHRGQQIRTITLMLAKVRERERKGLQRWFLPDERTIEQPQESFEGAVVITPMPGFYEEPVVTLDFASLYPSIMRAFNMCFSTLIRNPAEARARGFHFSDEDPDPTFRPVRDFETTDITPETKENPFHYVEKPTDVCFVTNKVRVGILPEILSELLSKRKQTKKAMKKTPEESVKYAVLDGYQLALKVCANSVYGFTGASKGFLPEKRIASNVTKAGRGMTNEAKNKVEFHYRDHGLRVVYGDTDSIFVHLPQSLCPLGTMEEVERRATALGEEMSELCNTCFLPPNDLEYEKFYWPILLKGKKRYAGWKVEPGKKAKLDAKGFECVRRDFAPIVSKTQKRVFDLLIKERDTAGAVAFARSRVEDLLNGRCEIEELTLSKQLTQPPENYRSSAAHVELAKRLIRDLPPTVAPKVGDRIDYLIRTGQEKQYQRAVTPDEIRSGEFVVDTRYYLDKQLRKPLFRVFDMVVDNPDDIFRVEGFRRQIPKSSPFAKYVTDRPRREKRQRAESRRSTRKKKQKVQSIHAFFN